MRLMQSNRDGGVLMYDCRTGGAQRAGWLGIVLSAFSFACKSRTKMADQIMLFESVEHHPDLLKSMSAILKFLALRRRRRADRANIVCAPNRRACA
jgi:hypothetical protein